MAPGDTARRVGQRHLETVPPPDEGEPAPTGPASDPVPPPPPADPAVPAEGSAAALYRRRRVWLTERQRRDEATRNEAGTRSPVASDAPPPPNG